MSRSVPDIELLIFIFFINLLISWLLERFQSQFQHWWLQRRDVGLFLFDHFFLWLNSFFLQLNHSIILLESWLTMHRWTFDITTVHYIAIVSYLVALRITVASGITIILKIIIIFEIAVFPEIIVSFNIA